MRVQCLTEDESFIGIRKERKLFSKKKWRCSDAGNLNFMHASKFYMIRLLNYISINRNRRIE